MEPSDGDARHVRQTGASRPLCLEQDGVRMSGRRSAPSRRTPLSQHPPTPYPWLVADIGGTNARFGLVHGPDLAVGDVVALRGEDFAGPGDAAIAYLERVGAQLGHRLRPQMAAFALATPISGDTIKLTNSTWVVARPELEKLLGVRRLRLLNDFEVLALALPHLRKDDIATVGPGAFDRRLPMAVIGPGTGLGVAVCVPHAAGWTALASEGGHATAAPADEFESEIFRAMRPQHAHISTERLLSGIGLPSLHRAVSLIRGTTVEELTAEEITRRALEAGDSSCSATLDVFCAMLGTFAGNVALMAGARGGVFIAGGIAQKLWSVIVRSRFRERFEAKGRFADYMSGIASGLITAPYAALTGAAQSIVQGDAPAPQT